MYKRFFAGILTMIMIFCTACSSAATQKSDRVQILTTVYAAYDIARQTAGSYADVTLLLKPGSEAHTFEPSPQDMITLSNCDILICAGGENDAWVDTLLDSIDAPQMHIIRMLDLVDALEEEIVEGMEEEEEEHHHGGEDHDEDEDEEIEWDEHVWMSPANAALIAAGISETLCSIDPDHSSDYAEQLKSFKSELSAVDAEISSVVSAGTRRELIFADRFPARYFVEAYGISYYAAFPGCSENTEASAATVSFLIDKVREDQIPVVLKIELSTGKLADTVSAETGAKVMTFYTGHNVTADDFNAGMTYIEMMRRNIEVLKAALY